MRGAVPTVDTDWSGRVGRGGTGTYLWGGGGRGVCGGIQQQSAGPCVGRPGGIKVIVPH